MNNKYKFYVISNKGIEYFNFLDSAKNNFLEVFNNNSKNDYIALGIEEIEKPNAIDLLINCNNGILKISQDYLYTSFKDDKLVTVNILNILENFKNSML